MLQPICKSDNKWPKSGVRIPTCCKMHRSTSHAILMYRRSFGTSHCGCTTWQCSSHMLRCYTPAMGHCKVPAMYQNRIGPATRCDEMDHLATILRVLEPSQLIADFFLKIAAVWPVSYPRCNVLLFSCDFHRSNSI